MKTLNRDETEALLPYSMLADYILAVLHDKREGKINAPPRLGLPLSEGGTLLLMPAADERLAITKLVTVHPNNREKGLPSVQAEVLVFDAATGERLLMLDGGVVTARRTAALSLLAARLLAPDPSGALLVVGAGTQAKAHLEAFIEGLGVREVYIASRDATHAEALAAHARQLGAAAQAVMDANTALARVALIVTATTSRQPVFSGPVRDDTFMAAVGAYRPDMAELPPAAVNSSRIYVDTLEGAQAAAGDLIQAGVDWSRVTPLEVVIEMSKPESGPVIFKSVGHALWDLAAARLAWDNLREANETN